MLLELRRHDKEMQVLILYLWFLVAYSLINFGYTVFRVYQPILESRSHFPATPGGDGFISSGSTGSPFWPIVFSFLPLTLINVLPSLGGAIGLTYRRPWGWWLSSFHFTASLVVGAPTFIFQMFFSRLPPDDEPYYSAQPLIFFWGVTSLVIAVFAIRFLFRERVMYSMGVATGGTGRKIAILIGLSLLVYILPSFWFVIGRLMGSI